MATDMTALPPSPFNRRIPLSFLRTISIRKGSPISEFIIRLYARPDEGFDFETVETLVERRPEGLRVVHALFLEHWLNFFVLFHDAHRHRDLLYEPT